MNQLRNLVLCAVLLFSVEALAQRGGHHNRDAALAIAKASRVAREVESEARKLSSAQLQKVNRLLSELSATLKGRVGGGDNCRAGERGCHGREYASISSQDLLLTAASSAYYASDKVNMLEVGINFLNDRDLNHLKSMCNSSSYSTEYECLKRGINNSRHDLLVSVSQSRDLILKMCDKPSSYSSEYDCLKKSINSVEVADFDYVLSTCQGHYYASDKVSCIKRGL